MKLMMFLMLASVATVAVQSMKSMKFWHRKPRATMLTRTTMSPAEPEELAEPEEPLSPPPPLPPPRAPALPPRPPRESRPSKPLKPVKQGSRKGVHQRLVESRSSSEERPVRRYVHIDMGPPLTTPPVTSESVAPPHDPWAESSAASAETEGWATFKSPSPSRKVHMRDATDFSSAQAAAAASLSHGSQQAAEEGWETFESKSPTKEVHHVAAGPSHAVVATPHHQHGEWWVGFESTSPSAVTPRHVHAVLEQAPLIHMDTPAAEVPAPPESEVVCAGVVDKYADMAEAIRLMEEEEEAAAAAAAAAAASAVPMWGPGDPVVFPPSRTVTSPEEELKAFENSMNWPPKHPPPH